MKQFQEEEQGTYTVNGLQWKKEKWGRGKDHEVRSKFVKIINRGK